MRQLSSKVFGVVAAAPVVVDCGDGEAAGVAAAFGDASGLGETCGVAVVSGVVVACGEGEAFGLGDALGVVAPAVIVFGAPAFIFCFCQYSFTMS